MWNRDEAMLGIRAYRHLLDACGAWRLLETSVVLNRIDQMLNASEEQFAKP